MIKNNYSINIPLYDCYINVVTNINDIVRVFESMDIKSVKLKGKKIPVVINYMGYWSVLVENYEYKLNNIVDVFIIIQDIIENTYKNLADKFIILHGSVIYNSQNIFLLIAPTKTGKTTLNAFLVDNNYQCLSEDIVIIDKNDYSIISVPHFYIFRELRFVDSYKNFKMCASGKSDLRNENVYIFVEGKKDQSVFLYNHKTVALILSRGNVDDTILTKCNFIEAYRSLIFNLKWSDFLETSLKGITRLIKNIDVYYLDYNTLEGAHRAIETMNI